MAPTFTEDADEANNTAPFTELIGPDQFATLFRHYYRPGCCGGRFGMFGSLWHGHLNEPSAQAHAQQAPYSATARALIDVEVHIRQEQGEPCRVVRLRRGGWCVVLTSDQGDQETSATPLSCKGPP